jgi:PKD repeat protein
MNHVRTLIAACLSACFLPAAQAQITINSSHMPKSGDTLRYSDAAISSQIDYKKTGAGITWDFSKLTPTGQDIYQYKSSVQVNPAYFFWGLSTFGLKVADSFGFGQFKVKDIYDFYKNSSAKFTAEGRGLTFNGFPIPSDYSDPDEVYQFPLEYGDRDSSTFKVSFQLATFISLTQKGYRINEVTGYGTVITPYGSFSCLQVKTTIPEIDTIGSGTFKFPFPRTTVQYKFLSTAERIPVLEVSGSLTGGTFTPQLIRYRDKYLGLKSPLRPVASFTVNRKTGSTNDTFAFTDRSTRLPSGWKWTISPANMVFTGGTSSTNQNPKVLFTAPGVYSVQLTASNTFGTDDTLMSNLLSVVAGSNTQSLETLTTKIFPIPAANHIIISPEPPAGWHFRIFDLSGKEYTSQVQRDGLTLHISTLPAGTYVLQGSGAGEQAVMFVRQ